MRLFINHRQAILAGFLPVFLSLVWFSPWLMRGKVLAPFDTLTGLYQPWRTSTGIPEVHNQFPTDAVRQYVPYRLWAEKSFREDGYLGWNPYVFGGTPQYANTMVSAFDWGMQIHRFLNFWTAWHLAPLLQFSIAGCGMYYFLRSRLVSPAASSLFSVAYMANWQFITSVYFRQILSCFCWMPWVLWALVPLLPKPLDARHSIREASWKTCFVPVFMFLTFTGGTLQHHAFVAITVGCLCGAILMENTTVFPLRLRRAMRLCILCALALGLASFMLEPTIQAYFDNLRSGQIRGGLGYEGGSLQPVLNALSMPFYVFPFPLGRPQTLDIWKAFRNDFMNVGFFGTLPVVLALASLFSGRADTGAKLMMIAGLLIPLTPLVGPLYHRVNVIWILGGCWAGAALLETMDADELTSWSRKLLRWSFVLLGIWLVVCIVLACLRSGITHRLMDVVSAHSAERKSTAIQQWLRIRSLLFYDELMPWKTWQLIPVSTTLLSFLALRWIRSDNSLAVLPAIAVAIQLSMVWFAWTTWSDEREPYFKADGVIELARTVNHGRLLIPWPDGKDPFLPANTTEPLGIAINGGYDSIHPLGITPGSSAWESSDGIPISTHMFTGPLQPTPAGWVFTGDFCGHPLWKHPDISSTVFFRRKNASGFNPLECSKWTMNRRKFLCGPGEGDIIISETWHRDWRYSIGGSGWTPPLRGPDNTMRIPFSSATATCLELRFKPHSCTWPVWVSLSVLLAYGLYILAVLKRSVPGIGFNISSLQCV